jgi:hypothetical protein
VLEIIQDWDGGTTGPGRLNGSTWPLASTVGKPEKGKTQKLKSGNTEDLGIECS